MSAKSNGIAQPNQRRYNQRQLASLVWQRDGGCHLRHFHPADCDGVHDGCHLVPKQTLKRAFHDGAVFDHESGVWNPVKRFEVPTISIDQILMDERNVISGCRLHHGWFDNGGLVLPDDAKPLGFDAFLREFGFEWNGRYWFLGRAA